MHEYYFKSFEEKENKKDIEKIMNRIAVNNGEYHDEIGHIKFYDKTFLNYDNARSFLVGLGYTDYIQAAVKYYDTEKIKLPKKYVDRYRIIINMKNNLNELNDMPHFAQIKSKLITCKNCESKIASSYMKHTNRCPVCHHDMRPQSLLENIENKKKKIDFEVNKLEKEKNEYIKKKKNLPRKWLVKIEYHV